MPRCGRDLVKELRSAVMNAWVQASEEDEERYRHASAILLNVSKEMLGRMYVCISICSPAHPSNHLLACPFIYPSGSPIHPSTHLLAYRLPDYVSIHPFICPLSLPFLHPMYQPAELDCSRETIQIFMESLVLGPYSTIDMAKTQDRERVVNMFLQSYEGGMFEKCT